MIDFKFGAVDECELSFPVSAKLGVASPTTVATIEQRVANQLKAIQQALIDAVSGEINLWRQDYGGPINKRDAIDAATRAISNVISKEG